MRGFFELPSVPALCNVLLSTAEEALAVPRGDVALALCHGCGFVYNRSFDARRVPYGAHYENALDFSGAYRRYAESLARRLAERYPLRGGRVVEIACGSGEFLALLCQVTGARGVGFDPSHAPQRGRDAPAGVELRAEWYGEAQAALPADLVVCRHALEHIEEPLAFLRTLRAGIGERRPALYFEVPNATWILDTDDLWDVIYEHVGYFSREALVHVFQRAGFEVLDCDESFERQFLWVEARPADGAAPEATDTTALQKLAHGFAASCRRRIDAWGALLDGLAARGGRAALWGAGSKGVTFANLFRDKPALAEVVDVNPHKAGMHVAGTGHRIRAPHELPGAGALDLVLVMNPIYRGEIEAELHRLGLAPECRDVL